LSISPVCLGTMGYGPPTQQYQVDDIIKTAYNLGINFIDTANCYDGPNRNEYVQGYSEKMIGNALKKNGLRDEFVLLTKAGVPMKPGEQNKGLSSSHLIRELYQSLKRLQTDYVDIFMIHWPDPFENKEEVLRAIDYMVSSGYVRYFGISNHQAWEVCEYLWESDKRNFPRVGVSEIPFSILNRRYENDLPFYKKNEIAVITYQPLEGGLLSGKYKRDKGMAEKGKNLIAGWTYDISKAQYDKLEGLEKLAIEIGVSLAEYSFAWNLSLNGVVSVIAGARSVEELKSAVKASEIAIPDHHFNKIDNIAPGVEKPRLYYTQP